MLTAEDRAVFKWNVTWAQGKLSGDKAPSGAAVPGKLPMELERLLTKAKTKRRWQGQRAKTRRVASSRREEDKATGPAPPAREADPAPAAPAPEEESVPAIDAWEEDPAPAASTREDAWKIVKPRHRRAKRKRGISSSSPTKDSKHPSAPSLPSQPATSRLPCAVSSQAART